MPHLRAHTLILPVTEPLALPSAAACRHHQLTSRADTKALGHNHLGEAMERKMPKSCFQLPANTTDIS